MFKQTFIMTLLFSLITALPGQTAAKAKTEWEDGLKGKVKICTQINYVLKTVYSGIAPVPVVDEKVVSVYDEHGNKIERAKYNQDGWLKFKEYIQIRYDDKGKMVEKEHKRDGSVASKSVFRNDDRGNIIAIESYGANGLLSGKTVYSYDDKGNQVGWEEYKSDGTLDYKFADKYDDKGNKIERSSSGSNGILSVAELYKYDDKGNQIEAETVSGFFPGRSVYKYDNKGNQTELAFYKPDGSRSYKFVTRFNAKGNKIKMSYYEADDSVSKFSEYEYDNKGNVIEELNKEIVKESGKTKTVIVGRKSWT
ncbi:MAG TPA: hypothetical protein PKG60_00920, partial [Spirochaetota bacterium]|nr:hypothetical protein [Spirochaetota bacterium]